MILMLVQHPTQQPAVLRQAVSLPLSLARIGGLPVGSIPSPAQQVLKLLERIDEAETTVNDLGQTLLDAIYTAVPLAPSSDRRHLLSVKRAIHANTIPQAHDAAIAFNHLPDTCASMLKDWLTSKESAALDALTLSHVVEENDEELVTSLLASLEDQGFLRGLALATPSLVAHLPSGSTSKPSWRLIRSLYHYVTRTCMKTSPFSTLTTVNLAGPARDHARVAFVANHLAAALIQIASADPASNSAVEWEQSPVCHIPAGGHSRLLLLPRNIYTNGVIYREETVVGADLLRVPPVSATVESHSRRRRLFDEGVLRARVPWKRAENPFAALAKKFPLGVGPLNGKDMAWIAACAAACKEMPGRNRAAELEHLRTLAAQVFPVGELGTNPAGLLYEDVSTGEASLDPLSIPSIRGDLQVLTEAASAWVQRSHAYDLMVARFIQRFGVGGQTSDALGFCMSLAMEGDGDAELMQALQSDRSATCRNPQQSSRAGATAAPRNIGAMIQIVAPNNEAVRRGEHLTVVNSLGNGIGSYQARFHQLLGTHTRAQLAQEIKKMWKGRQVLELTLWSECNTAQAACSGVLPELVLPGEPLSSQGVPIDRLVLSHNVSTNSLELLGRDGPIGLAYLGLTPQHLLTGYFRWLVLLADPWMKFPPLSESYVNQTSGWISPDGAPVIHRPRRTISQRVVIQREDWLVKTSVLQDLASNISAVTVRNWHRFRRQYGIPAVAYIHQLSFAGGTTNDKRKPQYVDFTSGVSLRALAAWLASCTGTVRICEALPGPGQHPHRDTSGQPRVCEYAVSLHWPKEER